MKKTEFNKLLSKHKSNLQEIIRLYCMDKIFLTNFQLEKVLKLRGDKK